MKYIVSGTNRPGARTLEVAKIIQRLFQEQGETTEIIDLRDVALGELGSEREYGAAPMPQAMSEAIRKLNSADGIVIVTPEYNGSMPGALKYFIDHWKYPDTFEFRPIALVGLGGRWGALRPVEHLQGVFGYRNAFIYPERIFISDVHKVVVDGKVTDPLLFKLMESQVRGFSAFTKALAHAGLDANSRLTKKP